MEPRPLSIAFLLQANLRCCAGPAEKPPQALSVMELLESELRPERLKQSLIDRITIDYQAMLDNPSTVTYSQSAVAYAFAAGWDRSTSPR